VVQATTAWSEEGFSSNYSKHPSRILIDFLLFENAFFARILMSFLGF